LALKDVGNIEHMYTIHFCFVLTAYGHVVDINTILNYTINTEILCFTSQRQNVMLLLRLLHTNIMMFLSYSTVRVYSLK